MNPLGLQLTPARRWRAGRAVFILVCVCSRDLSPLPSHLRLSSLLLLLPLKLLFISGCRLLVAAFSSGLPSLLFLAFSLFSLTLVSCFASLVLVQLQACPLCRGPNSHSSRATCFQETRFCTVWNSVFEGIQLVNMHVFMSVSCGFCANSIRLSEAERRLQRNDLQIKL